MLPDSFTKSMKNQLEGSKPSLRQLLHAEMGGYKPERPLHNIHASDLTYEEKPYCPRLNAICLLDGISPPDRYIDTCLQYTFEMGEQMHEMARCKLLKKYAVGYWRCPHCKHTTNTLGLQPESCFSCGTKPFQFEYIEVRFKCQQTGASGAIDCLIKLPTRPKLVILELKSIVHHTDSASVVDFKTLKAPLAEHELRTNLYMRLVENSENNLKDFIDVNNAMVFYMTKGYGIKDPDLEKEAISDKMTPFKEYWIDRNDKATDPYINKAIPMKRFVEHGIIPHKIQNESHCDKCKLKTVCDSNKYPEGGQTDFHLKGNYPHVSNN